MSIHMFCMPHGTGAYCLAPALARALYQHWCASLWPSACCSSAQSPLAVVKLQKVQSLEQYSTFCDTETPAMGWYFLVVSKIPTGSETSRCTKSSMSSWL